jgi:heme-degrading monooxygenase HmoA
MFAVIFEVQPRPGARDAYLALAKLLRPELEQIDGFIDNERFASQQIEDRILSLSTWRDEKAVIRWRTLGMHQVVQQTGRVAIFADYHLRVGEITADTHPPAGQQLLQERFDTTAVGRATVITIAEALPNGAAPASDSYAGVDGLVSVERFEGITVPGKPLTLAAWRDDAALAGWQARGPHAEAGVRCRAVRVIRDYGMYDRVEAPQYYPPL